MKVGVISRLADDFLKHSTSRKYPERRRPIRDIPTSYKAVSSIWGSHSVILSPEATNPRSMSFNAQATGATCERLQSEDDGRNVLETGNLMERGEANDHCAEHRAEDESEDEKG